MAYNITKQHLLILLNIGVRQVKLQVKQPNSHINRQTQTWRGNVSVWLCWVRIMTPKQEKVVNFLVGEVMRETKGRYDGKQVREGIIKVLDRKVRENEHKA